MAEEIKPIVYNSRMKKDTGDINPQDHLTTIQRISMLLNKLTYGATELDDHPSTSPATVNSCRDDETASLYNGLPFKEIIDTAYSYCSQVDEENLTVPFSNVVEVFKRVHRQLNRRDFAKCNATFLNLLHSRVNEYVPSCQGHRWLADKLCQEFLMVDSNYRPKEFLNYEVCMVVNSSTPTVIFT